MTEQETAAEWARCAAHPWHFTQHHVHIFNATPGDLGGQWIPFDLWPAQAWALDQIHRQRLTVILKARQIGFTWLALAYILWRMLFWPAETAGIFSRRETDAQNLLDARLKGMYDRLPAWMQARAVLKNARGEWSLSNGSTAYAFPTTGGRQYTFSTVLADEADFQPDLPSFMEALKPTIDAGGRMILLSTSDKDRPLSQFKQIIKSARGGANDWTPLFLPWTARPARDPEWYAGLCADALANTGSLDGIHQEYPATLAQALASREQGKRIPPSWIQAVFVEAAPVTIPAGHAQPPALPGLAIYRAPVPGRRYVLGADPAEGNPNSDESAGIVLDIASGEECATLAGRFEPSTFAGYLADLAGYYSRAPILPERNNHGHAVIATLRNQHPEIQILTGHDGSPGWLSSSLGKALLYSRAAETMRDGNTTIHDWITQEQLASIEAATLRAPEGLHDDRADAWSLANAGRTQAAAMADNGLAAAFGWRG